MPDLHSDAILIANVLSSIEDTQMPPQCRSCHLINAFLLKLILHTVCLPLHHLTCIEHRPRKRIHILLFGVYVAEAEPCKDVEELYSHKHVVENVRVLLVTQKFLLQHDLVIVGQILCGKEDLLNQKIIDCVDALSQGAFRSPLAKHGMEIHLVSEMVQVYKFLLPNLKLRHEVVVTVFVGCRCFMSSNKSVEPLVKWEQLIFAQ
mmetsp:Transcript_81307/g.148450  ORF Transcript_81307/g.148450 Transcript_81307/m.148450 type:complete len:205 (+) Transcript_81307:435-1049(+)